uniref:Fibrinogen C-terminal domain-containing protein n=1 Tax=Equus asinus TaxID=9793 RepID=A0A9L0I3W9_EQUAS
GPRATLPASSGPLALGILLCAGPPAHPPLLCAEVKIVGLGAPDKTTILQVCPGSPGLPGPKGESGAPGGRGGCLAPWSGQWGVSASSLAQGMGSNRVLVFAGERGLPGGIQVERSWVEVSWTPSCEDVLAQGGSLTSWYTIYLPNCQLLTVLCDMDVDRDSYKGGFGGWSPGPHPSLRLLPRVQPGNQELWVDLKDFEGGASFAKCSSFRVSGEEEKYNLVLGPFLRGTAGDSLGNHRNMLFTTHDQDNDSNSQYNCASLFKGAWWYYDCHQSNLNGPYLPGTHRSYAESINQQSTNQAPEFRALSICLILC